VPASFCFICMYIYPICIYPSIHFNSCFDLPEAILYYFEL
jgi:hypothetical protein